MAIVHSTITGDFLPSLQLSVDEKTGIVRAAYMRVRQGEVADTREVSEGCAFADYDDSGMLLGIELLAPCGIAVLDQVAALEPEPIKRFLRGSPPRELVPA
jgi:uncharacterized protein YuzE